MGRARCSRIGPIGESERRRLGPDLRHLVRAYARPDEVDCGVKPCAALDISIVLHWSRASDVERAIVARAITLVALKDVEEGLVAGPELPVCEVVRMRVAAFARDGIDRFDIVGSQLIKHLIGHRHDIAFTHAGLQLLVDHVVYAVDHRSGLVEQDDLVNILDLSGIEHDLLAVDNAESRILKLEEH